MRVEGGNNNGSATPGFQSAGLGVGNSLSPRAHIMAAVAPTKYPHMTAIKEGRRGVTSQL